MNTNADTTLREHISYVLKGGGAHIDLESALAEFPVELINAKIGNLPYTPWQILEHMRIAQWDILEFSRNAKHVSPKFPEGYWPAATDQADESDWKKSTDLFLSQLAEMDQLVMNSEANLFAPIPHGEGQTILREALLVADHNAYHLGALMTMKKMATEEKG